MSNDNIRELIHDPGHVLMSDVLKGTVSDQNDEQLPFKAIVHILYTNLNDLTCTVVGTFISVTYDRSNELSTSYCELEFKTLIEDASDLVEFSEMKSSACCFGIDLSGEKPFEMSEPKTITAVRLSNPSNGIINVLLRLE